MKCTLFEKWGFSEAEARKPWDPGSPKGFPGGLTQRPHGGGRPEKEVPQVRRQAIIAGTN